MSYGSLLYSIEYSQSAAQDHVKRCAAFLELHVDGRCGVECRPACSSLMLNRCVLQASYSASHSGPFFDWCHITPHPTCQVEVRLLVPNASSCHDASLMLTACFLSTSSQLTPAPPDPALPAQAGLGAFGRMKWHLEMEIKSSGSLHMRTRTRDPTDIRQGSALHHFTALMFSAC